MSACINTANVWYNAEGMQSTGCSARTLSFIHFDVLLTVHLSIFILVINPLAPDFF